MMFVCFLMLFPIISPRITQDSQPSTSVFEVPLPEVKFEGAGDNKGLCCSAENGGGEWSALHLLEFLGDFLQAKLSLS